MTGGILGFVARYPVVWHVIEAEGAGCETLWPAAMLRQMAGSPPDALNRNGFERLALPNGGTAVLRPQQMHDARLTPTLQGSFSGRPDLWRAHIDAHVFFWVTEKRRDGFVRACERLRGKTAGAPPVILAIETEALLTRHGEAAFVSAINSGSTSNTMVERLT